MHDHGGMSSSTTGMGMDMDMDMDNGTIALTTAANAYLTIVGVVIGIFALLNLLNALLFRQRISSLIAGDRNPAKPKNVLTRTFATLTAVAREAGNAPLPAFNVGRFRSSAPSAGPVLLVLLNVALLVILCFYELDSSDQWSYERIAYRCGYVSLSQFPLIFLLSGKNNLIGCVTGFSHERLNWLHRWCSRCLLLTVTMHMGYWFTDWAPYDYIVYQLRNDYYTMTGFPCWCLLVWITFSSFAPIRGWRYEVFVIQHLISFLALIITVFYHVPSTDWVYLWPGIAFFLFDRLIRFVRSTGTALGVWPNFPGKQASLQKHRSACRAELLALSNGYTKITINNPPFVWKPGQHVFVACHSLLPFQSHPFSIVSLPEDGRLEVLVRAHAGGTRKLLKYAEIQRSLESPTRGHVIVGLDGPYGSMRPLRQFDTAVFIAGGIGITFTLPLLRDLLKHWKTSPIAASKSSWLQVPDGAVTRCIRFVWVMKSRDHLNWFIDQLNSAVEDAESLQNSGKDVRLDMSIYITCDDTFTGASKTPSKPAESTQTISLLPPSDEIALESDTINEKKQPSKQSNSVVQVQEVDPRSLSNTSSNEASDKITACGPDGTCCCHTTVTDETDAASGQAAAVFRCNCHATQNISSSTSTSSELTPPASRDTDVKSALTSDNNNTKNTAQAKPTRQKQLHPSIRQLSGRPHARNIVRRCLEQARGETGVVACGPRGLNDGVRAAVVRLSDERAVHKGSGALGVWCHTEGYGY